MINPNKAYKQKQNARIVHIDSIDSYMPYVTIETVDGQQYEGNLSRCHSQWKRLQVGDTVGYSLEWNTMNDKAMIAMLIVCKDTVAKSN